jgi:hypothetical protein
MRSSFYFVGVAAAAIAGAGVLGFGCSSSSSPPTNNNPVDAATEAAACIDPSDASIATGMFTPIWTCYEQASVCGAQLTACAADCACNLAVLTSLECVATDAGTQQGCFQTFPMGLGPLATASTNSAATGLGVCLLNVGTKCGADVVVDGGDAGGDAGTKEDAASDASTGDAATDAATTVDAAADAGDSATP